MSRKAPAHHTDKPFQFNLCKRTSKWRSSLIFICDFIILNFIDKAKCKQSFNCLELSMILTYLERNKHFSFSVANLLSKSSRDLAVRALAQPQVFQGMQRLNILPIWSCQGQEIAPNLRIRTNRKTLVTRKVLYYTKQNIGEHVWLLSIPREFITVVSWKSSMNSSLTPPQPLWTFFVLLSFYFPSRNPTSLSEPKPSSSVIQVSSQTVLVLTASVKSNVNDYGETEFIFWSSSR